MRQRQPLTVECRGHQVRRLLLFIQLTTVGNGGGIEKIPGNGRHVVPRPKFLFPPIRLGLLRKNILINGCVHKSRARRHGRPFTSVMCSQVPCPRAAHRKTAHRHPLIINAVQLLHVRQCLQHIHFTGKFVCVAKPAVGMQHNSVLWRKLPVVLQPVGQKTNFA